jgi:hypothetical protein
LAALLVAFLLEVSVAVLTALVVALLSALLAGPDVVRAAALFLFGLIAMTGAAADISVGDERRGIAIPL